MIEIQTVLQTIATSDWKWLVGGLASTIAAIASWIAIYLKGQVTKLEAQLLAEHEQTRKLYEEIRETDRESAALLERAAKALEQIDAVGDIHAGEVRRLISECAEKLAAIHHYIAAHSGTGPAA